MNQGYFKPLRRKIGVAVLAMSCVFAAGWVRSLTIEDGLYLSLPDVLHTFASKSGKFSWEKKSPWLNDKISISMKSYPAYDSDSDEYWSICDDVEWRFGFWGFDFGAGSVPVIAKYRIEQWAFPCWSFVIPLTLLSAWLLLSKPKPPTTPDSENT